MNNRKMTDKEVEIFVKNNAEAYKRFKRSKQKRIFKYGWSKTKRAGKIISNTILWFCAVGGLLLSLFLDKINIL